MISEFWCPPICQAALAQERVNLYVLCHSSYPACTQLGVEICRDSRARALCSRVLYIKGTTRRMNLEVRRARFELGSSWLRMSWAVSSAAAGQPQIQIKTFTQVRSGAKCLTWSHLTPSNGIQGLTLLVVAPTSLL